MTTEQIQYVPLERITAAPQIRKRFDPEVITTMSGSLRDLGQLQPIRIRRVGETFVIVDGELRYRAAKMAGFTTIAVIIEEKELCDGEIIQRQLISNCHRGNLNEVEKARAIQNLMQQAGWPATRAAEKLGFSDATVTRLLGMLSLSPEILRQVETGALPASAAYEISRVDNREQQAELASRVVTGQLTRDQLVGTIKARERSAQVGQGAARSASRIVAKLADGKSVTISAPDITLDSLIEILESLKEHARRARTKNWSLQTLLKMLRDTSGTGASDPQAV